VALSGATGGGAGGGDHEWRPKANPWLIALVVTLAAFMEVLDTTIVNVALPHIAGAMSSSNDEATWTLTSYLVANSIILPVSGWLGSVIGRKRYFVICIAMFAACSLLCGISQSLPQLIIFRLFQGLFGGGLQPNQQSIILDTFPPAQRGKAFALTAVATVVAPVLGPTLGGLITDNISWRWIFLINVPIGVFTVIAVSALVEDPPWTKLGSKSIDYIGLGLIALGLGCMQIVMDRGEDADWLSSSFIQIFTVLAAVGLVGAVIWLLIARRPVVNLRVLKDRNFAVGSLLIFVMGIILYSSAVIIPQLAQTQLGYTATLAGYILSPGAVLITCIIPLVGRIMPYVQTRLIVAFGFVVLGTSLLYSNTITPDIDFMTLALMRIAQTVGLAFLFVPISTIAYATLPKEQNGDAAALFTMFRNVGGSIGISAATAMVTTRTQVRMAHLVTHLTPFDQPYLDLVQRNKEALMSFGHSAREAGTQAVGMVYTTLLDQASILAYGDVFMYCAIGAFLVVPATLLFTGSKAGGGGAPPAH
jgi:MFS transporter, DHA2 family, multidrug resistance protein